MPRRAARTTTSMRIAAGTATTVLAAMLAIVPATAQEAAGSGGEPPGNAATRVLGKHPASFRQDAPPRLLAAADSPTTSGAIFVGNLRQQATVIAARAASENAGGEWRLRHADTLYFFGRLHGRTADLAASERALERLPAGAGDAVARHLLEARLHSAFHRFDAALAALDAAAAAGAPSAATQLLRAQTLLASGQLEQARTLAAALPEEDMAALAFRANLLVEEGRLQQAERLFERAQYQHRGSNPYPLAWLHVQHGIALLRAGQLDRAHAYFAAAHARLPEFVLAAEHLAEVELTRGHAARAAELYRQVVALSDDPAFQAGLAAAERALGNDAAAEAAEAAAASGFEEMLRRFPSASWQHAAGWFSDTGQHARALELARRNHAARGDPSAAIALAEVAMAAGDTALACATLAALHRQGLNPPEATQLQPRCDVPL